MGTMVTRAPSPTVITSGRIQLVHGDETYVYRVYCDCGELQYVGMTSDLFGRLSGHARVRQIWLITADHVEWELFKTRAEAETMERKYIRELQPLHNVLGRMGAFRMEALSICRKPATKVAP